MRKLFFISIFVIISILINAQEHQEKKLNIGDFIIEHISDSYDWHITTIGHKHITIYLPVILISKQQGVVIFCSKKLHNETHSYKNFFINEEPGLYKGKIMEILPDGRKVRPIDISISKNVLALFISSTFLVIIFLLLAKKYRKNQYYIPRGGGSIIEVMIEFIAKEIAEPNIGHNYQKYMPHLLTLFFFILFNNLAGLIPIFPFGYNLTGNITVTMVLALFTFFTTQITANKEYWLHIFWPPTVPWWMKFPIPLVPIIEFMGIFIKPFVLMIRLFANILGGHIVMLAFFSLIFIFGEMNKIAGLAVSPISIMLTIFDTFLEILVSFIQAYVFTLLSSVYFGMANESAEHEH